MIFFPRYLFLFLSLLFLLFLLFLFLLRLVRVRVRKKDLLSRSLTLPWLQKQHGEPASLTRIQNGLFRHFHLPSLCWCRCRWSGIDGPFGLLPRR
jgi:lysylphosphatidylglycerol synthetase-like protein (DUF2156 family)